MYATVPNWIKEIPDHLKTQEMCNEAVCMEPWSLKFVPDQYKAQEMCERRAVHTDEQSYTLKLYTLKLYTLKPYTQKPYTTAEEEPYTLKLVSDHLKTQEMCN